MAARRHRVAGLILLCLVAGGVAPARAEVDEASRAAAREIGYAGVAAYQAGDYATAQERLEKAYAILRAPSLGLWSARSLAKLGKLVEAEERYIEVGRLPTSVGNEAIQQQARLDAQKEALALLPRIPKLVVRLEGAELGEVTVTIDGVGVVPALLGESRPLNPGVHTIVATRKAAHVQTEARLVEAERKTVVLRLPAEPRSEEAVPAPAAVPPVAIAADPPVVSVPVPPPDARDATPLRRTLGWVALVAGGVGLAAGATTGVIAIGKEKNLSGSPDCANHVCTPAQRGAVDSYNTLLTLSTVGFIAGAALAATGGVLLATSPGHADAGVSLAKVTVGVAPGAAFLRGEF